jgi:hypothetical protein
MSLVTATHPPLWPKLTALWRRGTYLLFVSGTMGTGRRGLSFRRGSNFRYKDCFLQADSLNWGKREKVGCGAGKGRGKSAGFTVSIDSRQPWEQG